MIYLVIMTVKLNFTYMLRADYCEQFELCIFLTCCFNFYVAVVGLIAVCVPFFGGLLGFFGGLAFTSTSYIVRIFDIIYCY